MKLPLFLIAVAPALLWLNTSYSDVETVSGITPQAEEKIGPWFTGTLLAPASSVIPQGYYDIEPSFFVSDTFGKYDREWKAHSVPTFIESNNFLFVQLGLTNEFNLVFAPGVLYNHTEGQSSTHFDDLPIGFITRLFAEKEGRWWPTILFSIVETFPTGRFQKLDPKKKLTQVSGLGSYSTQFGLVLSHLYHIAKHNYLVLYLTIQDTVYAPVHVKGFSFYGGGFGTRGKVRPGNLITTILSVEYSLTKNWALALDIQNFYTNKTKFSGKRGVDETGAVASVGFPSEDQLNLTPAIEYNFSDACGIIAGAWFSATGRNEPQFAGVGIGINFYGPMFSTKTKK